MQGCPAPITGSPFVQEREGSCRRIEDYQPRASGVPSSASRSARAVRRALSMSAELSRVLYVPFPKRPRTARLSCRRASSLRTSNRYAWRDCPRWLASSLSRSRSSSRNVTNLNGNHACNTTCMMRHMAGRGMDPNADSSVAGRRMGCAPRARSGDLICGAEPGDRRTRAVTSGERERQPDARPGDPQAGRQPAGPARSAAQVRGQTGQPAHQRTRRHARQFQRDVAAAARHRMQEHDGGHADRQYRDHNVAPVQRVPEDLPGSSAAALAVRVDHIHRGRFMTLSLPAPAHRCACRSLPIGVDPRLNAQAGPSTPRRRARCGSQPADWPGLDRAKVSASERADHCLASARRGDCPHPVRSLLGIGGQTASADPRRIGARLDRSGHANDAIGSPRKKSPCAKCESTVQTVAAAGR